jgi:hypothetical protein
MREQKFMFCLGMVHRSKIYYAHINRGSLCDNAPSKGYALLKFAHVIFCKIYTLIFFSGYFCGKICAHIFKPLAQALQDVIGIRWTKRLGKYEAAGIGFVRAEQRTCAVGDSRRRMSATARLMPGTISFSGRAV